MNLSTSEPKQLVTYRPALPEDAPKLAEISIMAGGGTFELLLKGLKRNVSVQDVMTELCGAPNTEYSFNYYHVAEIDGQIAGGINAVTVDERYVLAPNINPLLQAKFGFGIIQLIKFYLRAKHLRGMNILKAPRSSLHINDIAVFPQYRGMGIAKRLVEETVQRGRQLGKEYISLYVWEDNTEAIEFYKHLGFSIERTAPVVPHRYLPHSASQLMLFKLASSAVAQ